MSATANRADALFMAAMIPPAIPAPDAYLCSSVFICGLLFLSVFISVHLWPAFLIPCSSVFICGLYLWLSTRFEHYRGTARAVAGQSRVGAEVERTAQPVGALVGGIEIAEPADQRGGRADAIERDLHRAAGAQSG